MIIVGCDFHPSWQQVAIFDSETGEIVKRRLVHAESEAERFYQGLPAPSLIGIENWRVAQTTVTLLVWVPHPLAVCWRKGGVRRSQHLNTAELLRATDVTSHKHLRRYSLTVPTQLKRYHHFGSDHFITFSCYHRLALLHSDNPRRVFERTLEQVRLWYGLYVFGYVIMPEHVHLLVSEPRTEELSSAIQMLKQLVARRLCHGKADTPFWQARYYDFNVFTRKKWVEKLRYIHRNPVTRGLVQSPEDWKWSSYRHWLTGEEGAVEIESDWTFRVREKMGIQPRFTRTPSSSPASTSSIPILTPKEG